MPKLLNDLHNHNLLDNLRIWVVSIEFLEAIKKKRFDYYL
jgi:hypothetical protein